jgi:hypothetical protein
MTGHRLVPQDGPSGLLEKSYSRGGRNRHMRNVWRKDLPQKQAAGAVETPAE